MKDKVLAKNVFCFNPNDNGGESLTLTTEFISNGDPNEFYTTQELTLQSYGNSSSFRLWGAVLGPDNLRKLANELEKTANSIQMPKMK